MQITENWSQNGRFLGLKNFKSVLEIILFAVGCHRNSLLTSQSLKIIDRHYLSLSVVGIDHFLVVGYSFLFPYPLSPWSHNICCCTNCMSIVFTWVDSWTDAADSSVKLTPGTPRIRFFVYFSTIRRTVEKSADLK